MKLQLILKNIFQLLFFIFLLLISRTNNSTLCLLLALIQATIIIFRTKVSLFTVILILINFCLLEEYLALIGYVTHGVLVVVGVPIYFFELYICVVIFNFITAFFVNNTKCLENEKILFKKAINLNKVLSFVLIIISIIITILIFPTIPSLSSFGGNDRFVSGILSFGGWSVIPHLLLAITFMGRKTIKSSFLASLFVIFWYISHGERVDSLGLIIFGILLYYNTSLSVRKNVNILIATLFVIFIYISVGILRSGDNLSSINNFFKRIIVQDTACDVTHVFNCSVDNYYKENLFSGYTYHSYLINLIPKMSDPYSFQTYITNYYYTVGGGLFFAEPIANYGFVFMCFITILFYSFICLLLRYKNKYFTLVYLCLIISIFRIMWYGFNYPIISIFYIIPAILVFNYILTNKNDQYKLLDISHNAVEDRL